MELYDHPLSLNKPADSFLSAPVCTHGEESAIQSNPQATHPNIFTSVSFKFTGIILWQSATTIHEKLHFSQISVNALSLIPVTVCTACNKLNAQVHQRNNCCPLIRALHHHDQEDMVTPHHERSTSTWQSSTDTLLTF